MRLGAISLTVSWLKELLRCLTIWKNVINSENRKGRKVANSVQGEEHDKTEEKLT